MSLEPETLDVVVIGAGAAGLFCAGIAAQLGLRTIVLDHAKKPAEKVRISGGGRCNFTNIDCAPDRFLGDNSHFAKSALARYSPLDFCDLMARHRLSWTEKTLGQLFCDQKSGAVIDLLLDELAAGNGSLRLQTVISDIEKIETGFRVTTNNGVVESASLVVATGGLSIPKMGATGFAYDLAKKFGHEVVSPRAGLVPLTFSGALKDAFAALSGVAIDARVSANGTQFDEAILFTHRGLSGPAVLQASSYWREGAPIDVDLLPGVDILGVVKAKREADGRSTPLQWLEELFPKRFAIFLGPALGIVGDQRLGEYSNIRLAEIAEKLSHWTLKPTGTEGWRTAEVTVGGIATDGLSSKTMESRHVPGLYFIGECVDVTGWLGGYNFQWAWASAHAAATGISQKAS
ncbi:MAG: NAD(P)/FAD-dependent oxidoreductase [Pseudomonadota bacterium]